MKNGTRSNKLTLVGDTDETEFDAESLSPSVEAYYASTHAEELEPRASQSRLGPNPVMLFLVVSAACATAAVAAGTYALWLTRHQATHEALTNVQDLLQVCQQRMVQMESDLNRIS